MDEFVQSKLAWLRLHGFTELFHKTGLGRGGAEAWRFTNEKIELVVELEHPAFPLWFGVALPAGFAFGLSVWAEAVGVQQPDDDDLSARWDHFVANVGAYTRVASERPVDELRPLLERIDDRRRGL